MKIALISALMHLFLFFGTTLCAKTVNNLMLVGIIPYAISIQIGLQFQDGYLVESNFPIKITSHFSKKHERILTIIAN